MALVMLGGWDAAGAELTQAADSYGLAGYEVLACQRGWLAALRGDTAAAQALDLLLTIEKQARSDLGYPSSIYGISCDYVAGDG